MNTRFLGFQTLNQMKLPQIRWRRLRHLLIICTSALVCLISGSESLPRTSPPLEAEDALAIIQKNPQDELTLSFAETIEACNRLLANQERLNRSYINELYLARAWAYLHDNKIGNANDDILKVLNCYPNNLKAQSLKALITARLGSVEDALHQLEGIHVDWSMLPDIYYYKCWILFNNRDYFRCITVLNQRLSVKPTAECYILRAKALIEIGDPVKALSDLNTCISRWPVTSAPNAYFLRAKLLRSFGRYPEALENLLIAHKLGMDQKPLLFEAWSLYYSRQCYHFSKAIAGKLIVLFPECDESLLALAASCNAIGEYQKAEGYAQNAIKHNSDNSNARIELAWSYSGLENYTAANEQFDLALKVAPSSVGSLCGKSLLLSSCPLKNIQNGTEACKLGQRACEITKWTNSYCIATLAIAKAGLGKYEEAVALSQNALRLHSSTRNSKTIQYEELIGHFKNRLPISTINSVSPFRFLIEP